MRILWLVFTLLACGGAEPNAHLDSLPASTTKELTAFGFTTATNPGLSMTVDSTITSMAVTATVPFGTDVTGLVATFDTTGAIVTVGAAPQISGATPNDFSGPVAYAVTAEDGSVQTYLVTVTAATSAAKEITAFEFHRADNVDFLSGDVTAAIDGTTITATFPPRTDITSGLVARFMTTGSSVTVMNELQTSGGNVQDYSAPVVFRVTAGDGSTQDYTVTCVVTPSSDKTITAFSIRDMPMNVSGQIMGTNIAVTMPYGTPAPTMRTAIFTTTGVSVTVNGVPQASGITVNDFTNTIVYRVTAEDGTTQDYTVTVTNALAPFKDLYEFKFERSNNPSLTETSTGLIEGTDVTVHVPAGADLDSLVATFTHSGESVRVGTTMQQSGVTPNNFTASVAYSVHALDSSVQTYTVTVVLDPITVSHFETTGFRIAEYGTSVTTLHTRGRAPPGGATIAISRSNPQFEVPASVVVAAGASSVRFRVGFNSSSLASTTIVASLNNSFASAQAVSDPSPYQLAAAVSDSNLLLINEVLHDPADVTGDANCDGVRDAEDDEFIEIVNASDSPLQLAGVTIWDQATFAGTLAPRFVFPSVVLGAGEMVIVYGNGALGTVTSSPWCVGATASTIGDALTFKVGTATGLSLNNAGDTIYVTARNDRTSPFVAPPVTVVSTITDQSAVRVPELVVGSPFVPHSMAPGFASDRAFSPGTLANGLRLQSP